MHVWDSLGACVHAGLDSKMLPKLSRAFQEALERLRTVTQLG
jgi:hypothetical protein